MEAYRTEAVVNENGAIVISDQPFLKGEKLEVILLQRTDRKSHPGDYPLRGEPVKYLDPFGGVSERDWEALG